MDRDDLLETLRELEVDLYRLRTRQDRAHLGASLHPDFREVGRSGREYSREDTLAEFEHVADYPRVESRGYRLHVLVSDVALLTYVSAHLEADGALSHHTLRSSLWIRDARGWLLAFHQGTPTTEEVWRAT
jgi:hypothetical protein